MFVRPIEFHLNTYRPVYANAFTFWSWTLRRCMKTVGLS